MGGRENKRLGYDHEAAVRGHLRPTFPKVKRNGSQYGAFDRGDLGGVPGWTLQCKNVQQDRWPEWFEATTKQAVNNGGTRWWAVIRKARGKAVGESLFVMTLNKGTELMAHLRDIEEENARLKKEINGLRKIQADSATGKALVPGHRKAGRNEWVRRY